MERDTYKISEKVSWIFRLLDAGYLLRNEEVNDHAKRVLMRIIFTQIDNLLKYSGQLKNKLFNENVISREKRAEIEAAIKKLSEGYDGSFDIVRDKLAAHNQPIESLSLLEWWNSIDYSTVEILYLDAKEVQSSFSSVAGIEFNPIRDYSQLTISTNSILSENQNAPQVSCDRLALTKPNTVAMIACHESQEKAQLVVSVIDFIEIDLALTVVADNPTTVYERLTFDIGWMLVIMDFCSLIDNLFETNQYDPSLLEFWQDDIAGFDYLSQVNQNRNFQLEDTIRQIRNKFSAHIDSAKDIEDLYEMFNEIDLRAICQYVHYIVNEFCHACRMDIRTGTFLIRNTPMNGVLSVNKEVAPFDN